MAGAAEPLAIIQLSIAPQGRTSFSQHVFYTIHTPTKTTITYMNNGQLTIHWSFNCPAGPISFGQFFLYKATQRQNNHNMKNTEQLTIHWSFDCPAGLISFTYNTRTHRIAPQRLISWATQHLKPCCLGDPLFGQEVAQRMARVGAHGCWEEVHKAVP